MQGEASCDIIEGVGQNHVRLRKSAINTLGMQGM